MTKRVLDVGNCGPDHAAIRHLLETMFRAAVIQAHGPDDTLALLRRESIDLVLVNRKLDQDYSDGLEIIRAIKADPQLAAVPCMLITNHAEHQEQAVSAGAIHGFGKKQLRDPQAHERLAAVLKPQPAAS
jgi:two-component system chemotaxis response regulator CheY